MTFAVGIDLGTTHSVLGFAGEEGTARIFPVLQVIHAGEVQARELLPSFLYLPSNVELPPGSLALPWDPARTFAVGAFARDQGASVPARLVGSAKSWLSFPGIDRRAPVLPHLAPEEVHKVSPVTASARYLAHLREAWDHEHPKEPLAEQDVVVTVPASFDAVARELTVEACRAAGLPESLTLLEEPQAAVYAWVDSQGEGWRRELSVGDRLLVVDIGGGTTDLSLISVEEEDGSLSLKRVAVGDHILLGGDNMDLALAHLVRARLEVEGKTIDDWQMRSLVHGCRVAKEALLGDASLKAHPLVIPGRGAKLVGGSLRTELSRRELEATLVDGFFPAVAADARPEAPRRAGLTTLGLPYATDPAITRHLAAFVAQHAGDGRPTAVLFNGGVTKAAPLRARLLEVLSAWMSAAGAPAPRELPGADPDLAVARGAAVYGRVRQGRGLRIRGGTARAYYVGIQRAEPAVPGVPPRVDAICVAPFGMEEGSEAVIERELGLFVGEPATFRFFSSSTRQEDAPGTAVAPAELTELAPIETTLAGEEGHVVPVKLASRVTEVGTLELSAVETKGGKRWRLEYDLRAE